MWSIYDQIAAVSTGTPGLGKNSLSLSALKLALAVAGGAGLGALLRWGISLALNHRWTLLPPGTLVANWLGAYCIGLALAYFQERPDLGPEWRLFVITGFLGGLTTFSTFSAEIVEQLQGHRWGWALLGVACHVIGCLGLTVLGLRSWR